MTTPSLITLAPELLFQVVAHVRRPSELCNLCLTSKALCAAARPVLYHSVTLVCGADDVSNLKAFYGAPRTGHKHLREMELLSANKWNESMYAPGSVRDQVVAAIVTTPKNALTKLLPPKGLDLSEEVIVYLMAAQQSLRYFATEMSWRIIARDPAAARSWLSHLTCLDLPCMFRGVEDITAWGSIVCNARALEDLRITGAAFLTPPKQAGWHEGAETIPFPKFVSALFDQSGPLEDRLPLKLKYLSLRQIDFTGIDNDECHGRRILEVIDWSGLQSLNIRGCWQLFVFIPAVASIFEKAGKSPSMLFLIMPEDEWQEPPDERDRPMPDTLITACTALEKVWLQAARKSTISMPGLAKHSSTLRQLAIDNTHRNDPVMTTLSQADSPFARLEQLAMQTPSVALLAPLSASDDSFRVFLMQLPCSLPHLRVLRLCNLPTAEPGLRRSYKELRWANDKDEKLKPVKRMYLNALDVFATHVLTYISETRRLGKLSPLRVLCFGELGGHWDIDPQPRDYDEPEHYHAKPRFAACYRPVEREQPDGGLEVVAERVRVRDIFYDDRLYDSLSDLVDMD